MKTAEIVGARLKRWRESRELTQVEFGKALEGLLGKEWPPQAVSAAERGLRSFSAEELLAIAVTLQYPVGGLFVPPLEDPNIEFPGGSVRWPDQVAQDASMAAEAWAEEAKKARVLLERYNAALGISTEPRPPSATPNIIRPNQEEE